MGRWLHIFAAGVAVGLLLAMLTLGTEFGRYLQIALGLALTVVGIRMVLDATNRPKQQSDNHGQKECK